MVKPVNQILGNALGPARPVRDGAPATTGGPPTDQLTTTPETHTVVRGDTLSALAAKYGVTLEQLRQLNPELFQAGTDSRGRARSADGGKIYEGDAVRLRAAAAAPPAVTAAQTSATSDRVVAAAKQFIDAAGSSADAGVAGEAQAMLALIPAGDPDRAAYEAKVKALAAKAPVAAPAGDSTSDLATLSEAFNDASKAYDQAQDQNGKAAARAQAILAYQRIAQAAAALPAGEAKDVAQGQLEMMELRLKGMAASDAAIQTARQAAGLAPANPAAPARPIDPAAQDAFMAAQAKFDEASEGYDNAVKNSTSLAQAAAAIQTAQQQALAAFNEALAAGSKVGPSAQGALDAMAARLKQMGISDKAISDAKAKAPPLEDPSAGAGPTAGGPTPTAPGTVLPMGSLPGSGTPAATPAATTPQAVTDQFTQQRQLFLKAIEDFVNSNGNGDQAGAENARARAKAAYTAAAKLVGQMDANTKPSYNKMLDDFEDKLQFYRVASIAEMDPIRKEAKLTPSASTAWAPANQAPGAPVPDVSKIQRNGASPTSAGGPVVTPKSEEPKSDEERKAREQLAQMLPKMNAGQITKLPYDTIKAASSEQRGFMLKELLDHWWVGGDKKKYAADVIEIASGEGKLDATLRQIDIQMKGNGIKQIFKKLKGADRERTVKNIFWDLKDMNPVAPDVLAKVAGEMKKDDVRAVLKAYGYAQTSDWFKRVPPEVKAQWAKTLDGGWFGKSSEDGAMIKALQAAATVK